MSLSLTLLYHSTTPQRIPMSTPHRLPHKGLGIPIRPTQPSLPLTEHGLGSIVTVEFRKRYSITAGVRFILPIILGVKSINVPVRKVTEPVWLDSVSNNSIQKESDGKGDLSRGTPNLVYS